MSWDFDIKAKTSDEGWLYAGYEAGYTYNVAPMYAKAFGEVDGKSFGIRDLHEMQCIKAAPLISHAITQMMENPEEFRAMNPPNGWGNYDGALEVLRKLYGWGVEHPLAYYDVS